MTKYGTSPWTDLWAPSRVPEHAPHRGSLTVDVVIVGAGLTGCLTAQALSAAGVKVAILDAARVGRGATGSAIGLIAEEPGVSFAASEKALGPRASRHVFRAWRRAALDLSALFRRLDVKCRLQSQSALTVARTAEQAAWLAGERKARRAAAFDVPLLAARAVAGELAVDATSATRDKSAATVDPYRACQGVAAVAARGGAHVFERSAVRRITFGRKTVDVLTAAGAEVHAAHVVVTTGLPTPLFTSLARHFKYETTYLVLTDPVPAVVRKQMGRRSSTLRDLEEPPHVVRWLEDERLMIAGATAPSVPERLRAKALAQRTGQLMYELSTLYPVMAGLPPAYGWDAPHARTADGLPYVGPHRNFPRHLFAFGDSSGSMSGAYLASRILTRHILGDADPADAVFDFTRHGR